MAIKYEEVKQSIEAQKWKLLSETYKNLNTDLIVQCPEGHEVHITYQNWRAAKVHECPICIKMPVKKINEKPTKKSGYRILAFDQASITSGWAVFDDVKLINYGHWTSNGLKSTQRISQTKLWVASMADMWQPDLIVLEDIQLQKFDGGEAVTTFKKLAHLQGVLKNYCYEQGFPYEVVPPATWRNFCEIKGRARSDQKKSAQIKVKQIYDVTASTDEADAIMIGRWAAAQHKSSEIISFL